MDDVAIKAEAPTSKVEIPKKDDLRYARLAANFFEKLIFIALILLSSRLSSRYGESVNYLTLKTCLIWFSPFLISFLLYFVINVIAAHYFGGTIGKLLFSLRIKDSNDSRPKLSSLVLREITKLIPWILIFALPIMIIAFPHLPGWVFFLDLVLALFFVAYVILALVLDIRHKGSLQDLLSHTTVTRVKPTSGLEKILIPFFAVLSILAYLFLALTLAGSFGVFHEHNRDLNVKDLLIREDVALLSKSLRSYKTNNGSFPDKFEKILALYDPKESVFADPKYTKDYVYRVDGNGSSATLLAKLHTETGYWCWNSNIADPPPKYLSGSHKQYDPLTGKKVQMEAECQP